MNIDRPAARWIIVILVVAGLAWVEAALHSNHYYRLTYAYCEAGSDAYYCHDWRLQATYRAVFIVLLGIAAWIYNERRVQGTKP